MSSPVVVPAGRTANLVILSPNGKYVQFEYILDNEDIEYLTLLKQATDTVVISACTSLVFRTICQKASSAVVALGVENGIPSLIALGMILLAHYSNDQPDQAEGEQFVSEFNTAVDKCLNEIRTILMKKFLDTTP
jgi:hypothetical protein